MVNTTAHIQEAFWQPALTHTYDLSILLGVDRLLYCIADSERRILGLRAYQTERREAFGLADWAGLLGQDAWLAMTYRKVRVGLNPSACSLVPQPLFDPSQARAYLDYVAPPASAQMPVLHHPVGVLGAEMVFASGREWIEAFGRAYPNAQIAHSAGGLLPRFVAELPAHQGTAVFANVQGQLVQLAAFEQGKLLFYNQFEFTASADFLYYVLLAFQQLQLKPHQHPLCLSGDLLEDSEIYGLLYKYVRHLHFLPRPSQYSYGQPFEAVPAHFYADLLSLSLCESSAAN